MEPSQINWIANFIWGIADDVLRDLYVRGKYRDVILPMTVLRRLDSLLEPTKHALLEMKVSLDKVGAVHQDHALRQAAGQAFYNSSKFTLRDLKSRTSQSQLKADFEAYLEGFSPNVQDILEKFEFRNQIPRLSKADALGTLIEKFLSPDINLSPNPVLNADGSVIQRTEREIELLREYRARLVADVVTGKLDVRGAKPRPADETDERKTPGDLDALVQDVEYGADVDLDETPQEVET